MRSSKIVILVLLIWSIHLGVAENIIVSPLCGSNSPPSCVTLSQYISSNNRVAAFLVLLPGVHTLVSPLRVQNIQFFYLQGQGQSSQVTISCNHSSPSPDFEFVQVNEVAINNLVFVQCSVNIITGSLTSTVSISYAEFNGSHIDRVLSIVGSNNVSISHSIFQSHQSNTSTEILYFSQINNLKLSHCMIRDIHAYRHFIEFRGINKTEIFQCNFTNNTVTRSYSIIDFQQIISAQISCCSFENNSIGRYANVLSFDGDTIGVTNTTFSHNIIDDYGYVVELQQTTSAHISWCAFENNFIGRYANVLSFDGDTIGVTNTTFSHNIIDDHGYVVELQQTTSAQISWCEFENNFIGRYANVLSFDGDTIGVTNTTFSHNILDDYGYVVELRLLSIFGHISCSTFWNNSFIDYSRVLYVRSGSIISISNSTFILNRQIGGRYGDILYCTSSCIVISSVFKNNSIGDRGDIVNSNSQTSIFASEFAHNSIGQYGKLIARDVEIDCTLFLNNSFWDPSSNNAVVSKNSQVCNNLFVIGERATSTCSDCEGKIQYY